MSTLVKQLCDRIEGEVASDETTRAVYSVDASIYEVKPLVIVSPKHLSDIVETVKLAQEFRIPLTARGAATGITGGCLGEGIICDLSRHMNKILEINVDQGYALCEPGVVQNRLNEALAPLGYRLGPDTSTGDRATLGGMVANNSAGARSLRYGQMSDHLIEVEMVLANGDVKTFGKGPLSPELARIRDTYRDAIVKGFPKLQRRVSGYSLNALLEEEVNLCKIIAGAEGTLGIVTKIKVNISPLPHIAGLCVIPFETMQGAMEVVPSLLDWKPLSLEMMDDKILETARGSPAVKDKLKWLPTTRPAVILVAEFEDEDILNAFTGKMGSEAFKITSPDQQKHVWEVRKAGLGLLLSKRTYSRAIAFIEDLSVPPEALPSFMKKLLLILDRHGKEAGIYGHVGAACLHIRPYIDLRKEMEVETMVAIMKEITPLVIEHGGTLSGEHGDGRIRSWLNPALFGETLYRAFVQLKEAFDPTYLFNPGKIVHGPDVKEKIRKSPQGVHSFLNFDKEGGFSLSADLCNGNGKCRKMEGTMCPSFQATGNEYDTTRARAQALRAAIRGDFPLTSQAVHDVLDLCLECKGCKKECPSQVDMAKMKSEFLYQYQKEHGVTLRSRLLGNIASFNRFSAPFAPFVNTILGSKVGKWVQTRVGIAKERALPELATESFSKWVKQHKFQSSDKMVVLFNDTFTEFNRPQVGIAAVHVLEKLGFEVIVPKWECCGRPLISKGLLVQAKERAKKLVQTLSPYIERGIPIIGLEPSCLSALQDDYEGLIDENRLKEVSLSFDAFLAKQGPLPFTWKGGKILVHGHCHQKALEGMGSTLEVLKSIEGAVVEEIPSGCCGMAGSFGYEAEHYRLSMQIGKLVLFPAIKGASPETTIVSNGFSCQCQIEHGTSRTSFHLAELLHTLLP